MLEISCNFDCPLCNEWQHPTFDEYELKMSNTVFYECSDCGGRVKVTVNSIHAEVSVDG